MYLKRLSKKVIAFSAVVVVVSILLGSLEADGASLYGWDFVVTRIISCLLGVFLIIKLDLLKEVGFRKSGLLKGILLGLPLLVLGIASAAFTNAGKIESHAFLGIPHALLFTFGMLLVGLMEEIIYRGLVLNNMLRHWGKDSRGVWKSVLAAAAIFGLAHLPNIFFAPAGTVAEIGRASCRERV